jgi:hypothetical protein
VVVPNFAAIAPSVSPGRIVYVRPEVVGDGDGPGDGDAIGDATGDAIGDADEAGAWLGAGLPGLIEAAGEGVDVPRAGPPLPLGVGAGAPGPRDRRRAPRAAPTITTVAGAANLRTPSCSSVAVRGPRSTTIGSVETKRPGTRAAT